MSTVPDQVGSVPPSAPHDCELEGCTRRAARGRDYCSVSHLLAAGFAEGSS